jgi:hypothetical protein
MERIFPTFCHVSDYDEQGFSLIPQMIESSYPLTLWAPPGATLNEYFNHGDCSISPEELIRFVEKGIVQIIGRENWLLDEQYRQKYADDHPFAKWYNNFDGALKSIWREQQSIPEHERSVRIAPEEDGWKWADALLQAEPERIDSLWERIKKKQIPPVSLKRIQIKGYGEKDKYDAVRQVLRDARNHTRAIDESEAELPFLLDEKDGNFFRFLEKSGRTKSHYNRSPQKGMHLQFTEAFTNEVHRLIERLKHPEKVYSLGQFVGSEAHKDMANWLHSTAQLAELYSRRDLRKFMVGQLRRDIAR